MRKQATVTETGTEEKPDVPAAFPDSLDTEPAVKAGLAFCEAHGKSPEGWIKSAREARRLAWRVAIVGGTTDHWNTEIGQIAASLAERDGRLARAKARGLLELADNVEAQIDSLKWRATELRALIEASGPGAVENQATRGKVLDAVRRTLDRTTSEIAGYARGHVPEELADRHIAAQDALVAAEDRFDAGDERVLSSN